MKALITGAAGFAGSHLAEHLLDQGVEVIAMVRPDEKDLSNLASILTRVRVERADVRDGEIVPRILRETKPNRLYHLAAMSSPAESFQHPRLTYEVNFTGTLNILSALRQLESDCRLLYISSSEVYGAIKSDQLPLGEETPLRPSSPYAGSKAAAELLTVQFFQSYGLPIVRARPFNHTGPRQSPTFVCSNFAQQIAEVDAGLRPMSITVGDLNLRRDFSDVRDVVRGYRLLLEQGEPGEVYILASEKSHTLAEVLDTLIDLAGIKVEIKQDRARMKSSDVPDVVGNCSKFRNLTGWQPEISFAKTLRDLLDYWRDRLER